MNDKVVTRLSYGRYASTLTQPIPIGDVLPGGIQPTDYRFDGTYPLTGNKAYDETCSRCRKPIEDDDVALLIWLVDDPNKMYSYCCRCRAEEMFKI